MKTEKNALLTIVRLLLLTSALVMTVTLAAAPDPLTSAIVYAEDPFTEDSSAEDPFSEEGLFSDDIFVEEGSLVKEDVTQELNQESLGISGEIRAAVNYNSNDAEKSWLDLGQSDSNYTGQLSTDLLFDARFKNRIKLFWDLKILYDYSENDSGQQLDLFTRELFVDIPFKDRIYVKAGKQVLKWGRSYFWNPTDLINVERKDILNLDNLGGIEGIKIQIPYGVRKNLYLFLNTDGIDSIDDTALSGKYEFLKGSTEMSFSAWLAKDARAVYGFDISSRVNDIDVRGEISLSKGDNYSRMDYDSFDTYKSDEWVHRISAGFTKFFDYGDVSDRISLTGELYYNSNGYEKNIYQRIDDVADPVTRQMVKMRYLQDVYQPNLNSKYYAAVFTRYNEFLDPDISFAVNGIFNLVDGSKTVSAGINYQPVTNLSLDLNLLKFFGSKNTEYVLSGNEYSISLGTTYRF